LETGNPLSGLPDGAVASDLSFAFDICATINECPEEVSINFDLSSDTTIQASQRIVANSVINTPSSVIYKAGENVTLQPGFTVVAGATFTTKIGDCTAENTFDNATEFANIAPLPNNVDAGLRDAALSANDVHIFPNPTSTTVTIELTKPITGQITLYNSFGQQLALLPINQNNTMLDLSTYPTGVYWIALSDMEQQERVVKKVVKQ